MKQKQHRPHIFNKPKYPEQNKTRQRNKDNSFLSLFPFPLPVVSSFPPSPPPPPPAPSSSPLPPLLPLPLSLPSPAAMMATLQPDQLKQLKDIFMRFDMDSDGSLTQLELAALLRSLGLKPTGDQLQILLSNMDANGNGYVEFDELVHAILPDMNEDVLINQEQLLEVFRSFDRDGNGYITAAELAGSMAKMGHPLTYKELSEMMREADTNGDGVISLNEFANIMAKSASDFLGI
ncbi:probable calcium-binding protein CML16 [Ricinus communis]|uniref:probable calcium-binding protein CML16 n=1 Tax=Ricinus communis TaxID=3988 RepID=UPI00201B0BE6|nr:probable calcium-binding protein CML16 [Ricinus communis]